MSLGVTTNIPAGVLGSQQASSVPGGLHGSSHLAVCVCAAHCYEGCILRGQLLVHVPQDIQLNAIHNNALDAYKLVEMHILPIDDRVH